MVQSSTINNVPRNCIIQNNIIFKTKLIIYYLLSNQINNVPCKTCDRRADTMKIIYIIHIKASKLMFIKPISI